MSDSLVSERPVDRRGRLRSFLLPEANAARPSGWRRRALLIALGAAGFLLVLLRLPVHSWNVLWAEDGPIFIEGALRGSPTVLIEPYAGYLHIVPRIESFIAVLFPLGVVPTVVTLLAAATVAATGVAVYVFAGYRIRSTWVTLAVWLSFVTLPIAVAEVSDNLANLHWYLIAAAFWAAIYRADSRGALVLQATVIAAAVLSDPLSLIVLPIIVLRFVIDRRLAERALFVVVVVAAVIQLGGVAYAKFFGTARLFETPHPVASTIAAYYSAQVATPTLFGVRLGSHLHGLLGGWVGVVATLLIVAILVAGFVLSRSHRTAIVALAGGSLAFSLVMLLLQWNSLSALERYQYAIGTRYLVDPILLMTGALLCAVDAMASRIRRRAVARVVGVLALCWVLLIGVLDYRVADVREGGPSWEAGLHHAEQLCSSSSAHDVRIPITPAFFEGPDITCAVLEQVG